LSSRPPEVDVPLPLAFDPVVIVGAVAGLAELAAGSPVVDPRPLGTPLCAIAAVLPNTIRVAISPVLKFIFQSFRSHDNSKIWLRFLRLTLFCPGDGTDRCQDHLKE
jgi:hypothetical protein